jgi:glycine/D-amino acid oxidase-like deaminating enzyme
MIARHLQTGSFIKTLPPKRSFSVRGWRVLTILIFIYCLMQETKDRRSLHRSRVCRVHNIYKQGINLVPWQKDLFWIGSTYEWDFIDTNPSPDFRKKVTDQLKHWLKVPFEIVDHIASERPANMERRPFVGLHPAMPSIGIFNGMGTKGCSLAPYFANEFTNHLVHGTSLTPLVDVGRFSKILSKGR